MPYLLNVSDLSIAFGSAPPLVRQLSFKILAGELVGLVGPSGSGKSLTAMTLLGLAGPAVRITAGQVAYRTKCGNSYNLLKTENKEYRKLRGSELGYVAQDCQASLNPLLTCGSQLVEAVTQLQPALSEVDEAVKKYLSLVELASVADRIMTSYPHQLSGGQLQRVLIALALIGEPRLLIADEPTTALDAITQVEIMRLIKDLRDQLGMAVLLITHDTHLLSRVADRIITIDKNGGDHNSGPTEVFRRTPKLAPQVQIDPLSVKDLTISYEGGNTKAVRKVSFELAAGEFLALVGPSGCGKSTLAKWLVGLLIAEGGTVSLGDRVEPANFGGTNFRRFIKAQLVFQDILGSLNPGLTVSCVIGQLCKIHGHYCLEELFAAVGLDLAEVGDRYPPQLSGGQRQRVVLMRALAAGPAFLVCDEAVAALDAKLKLELQALLKRTCSERGVGVLFITHDLREVVEYADRVLVMAEGQIVEVATPQALVADAKSKTGQDLVAAAGL